MRWKKSIYPLLETVYSYFQLRSSLGIKKQAKGEHQTVSERARARDYSQQQGQSKR